MEETHVSPGRIQSKLEALVSYTLFHSENKVLVIGMLLI
jgi:hypothetical protein